MSQPLEYSPSPGAPAGSQNAVKNEADKLSNSRTFCFKASELKAYNKAKPSWMPLRRWIRHVLNKEAGHPAPDIERFTLVVKGDEYMFNTGVQQLLGHLVRIGCYQDLKAESHVTKTKATLNLSSPREQNEIQREVANVFRGTGIDIEDLKFKA